MHPHEADVAGRGRNGRESWLDAAFLCAVVGLSVVAYVGGLGFYSDDWAFLSDLRRSGADSVAGLYRGLVGSGVLATRPGHVAYMALLYERFGLHPLPYHLVHTAVLMAMVVLAYLVMRVLHVPRVIALAVAATYGLLPHYSADRYWFAAFQGPLSFAFYFLSFYADVRAARGRLVPWKALSLGSLVASVACYEIAVPLFLVNAVVASVIAWRHGRRPGSAGSARRWARAVVPQLVSVALLVALALQKTAGNSRLAQPRGLRAWLVDTAWGLLNWHYDWLHDYGLNVRGALTVSFKHLGVMLPRMALRAVGSAATPAVGLAALAVAVVVFVYLRRQRPVSWRLRTAAATFGLGLVVYAAGYSIFLTTPAIQFTPTGIGNRTALGAAVGVAITFVAGAALLTLLLPARGRHQAFCAGVSLVCAASTAVVSRLGGLWSEAYREERAVLGGIREDVPVLAAGSTVVLDGTCPYRGPAIVFESPWDLKGALEVSYRTWPITADVVTHRLTVTPDGLRTKLYGSSLTYPYGPGIVIYNVARRRAYPMPDHATAVRYFEQVRPTNRENCPISYEGHGVSVL